MARVPVAFIYQSYRLFFLVAIPTRWLSLTHVCTRCGLGIDFQRGLVILVDAVAGQRVSYASLPISPVFAEDLV
ncbi:hypothetical protein B0H14DRAFT_3026294 [Mycena olivaceomarginata]|nr:hypothetical protein B0H14DRAFT_3026294 [Mycena olivaceomarginata]